MRSLLTSLSQLMLSSTVEVGSVNDEFDIMEARLLKPPPPALVSCCISIGISIFFSLFCSNVTCCGFTCQTLTEKSLTLAHLLLLEGRMATTCLQFQRKSKGRRWFTALCLDGLECSLCGLYFFPFSMRFALDWPSFCFATHQRSSPCWHHCY